MKNFHIARMSVLTYQFNLQVNLVVHTFVVKGVSDVETCLQYLALQGKSCEHVIFVFPPNSLVIRTETPVYMFLGGC